MAGEHSWLRERYGTVVGNGDLSGVLGFRSPEAFRSAVKGGRIPIPLFRIPGRRGHYAKVIDVERWLESLGEPEPTGGRGN